MRLGAENAVREALSCLRRQTTRGVLTGAGQAGLTCAMMWGFPPREEMVCLPDRRAPLVCLMLLSD
jgi:hypothetical protein